MRISEKTAEFIAKLITGDNNLKFCLCENGKAVKNLFLHCGVEDEFNGTKWRWAKDMLLKYNSINFIGKVLEMLLNPQEYIDRNINRSEIIEKLNQYLDLDGFKIEFTDKTFSINTVSEPNGEKVINIIFGSTKVKPDIIIEDAISNKIKVKSNKGDYIIYTNDKNISGLRWSDLILWWKKEYNVNEEYAKEQLLSKLTNCCEDGPEKKYFEIYVENFLEKHKEDSIALLPQVWYHYDPKTKSQRDNKDTLYVQRLDFMMLLPNNIRIVIEIDGIQHYSKKDDNGIYVANPELYSKLTEHDRLLQLQGYRVLRYGGYEFKNEREIEDKIINDINRLFKLYEVN